jgi:tetratricopeptide (TPR) repeat protein
MSSCALRIWLLVLLAAAVACGGSREERLDRVQELHAAGQYAESVELLREILSEQPADAEVSHLLGLALVRSGRRSQAIWPLQDASSSPEFAVEAGTLLASVLLADLNFEEAVRAADRVLEEDPAAIDALALRAQARVALRQPELALSDLDRLLELDSIHTGGLMLRAKTLVALNRHDEAEEAYRRLSTIGRELDEETAVATCFALAGFLAEVRKDAQAAEGQLENCLERHPESPAAVVNAVQVYDALEQPEKATGLLEKTVEAHPEALGPRLALANRLSGEHPQEAEALLEAGAREVDSAEAWSALAKLRRAQGDYAAAREAFEEALLRATGDTKTLRFELGNLLVDLGELEAVEEIARSLEETSYREYLLGRVALQEGDAQGALEHLEASIVEWPNNAGAHLLAAEAAASLGDLERAMSELREATRASPEGTDASVRLARLHLALGEYDEALTFASRHLQLRGLTSPEAHLIAAKAAVALERPDEARGVLERLRSHSQHAAVAVAELATLERSLSGWEAAVRIIEESGLDLGAPENAPALQRLVDLLVDAGQRERALTSIDQQLSAHPETAALHAIRGRVCLRLGDLESAGTSFDRALSLEAERPEALAGRAELEARAGRMEFAIELLERASAADPAAYEYPFRAAQLLALSGQEPEAEARFRGILRRHPGHEGACNDLAWMLAERGESLDEALQLAERASRLAPTPEVLDTLGWVHLRRGEAEPAAAAFRRALALREAFPEARFHLGLALLELGDRDGARRALRQALAAGPFPEADRARAELSRLDATASPP